MSQKTDNIKQKIKKEKTKWIMVALMLPVLLMVIVYNVKSLNSKKTTEPVARKKPVQAAAYTRQDTVPREILRLEPVPAEVTFNASEEVRTVPVDIRDIFALVQKNGFAQKQEAAEEMRANNETFKLQGTIVNEKKAVVFINNQILSIGDKMEGYTVTHISQGRAVLNDGSRAITVVEEEAVW